VLYTLNAVDGFSCYILVLEHPNFMSTVCLGWLHQCRRWESA